MACNDSFYQKPSIATSTPTSKNQKPEPNPEWGVFDNVSSIEIIINGLENYEYQRNHLTFNTYEALNEFINDIRVIEDATEITPNLSNFEGDKDYIKKYKNSTLFCDESKSPDDEEKLDITCVTLLIEYNDSRKTSRIYEFTDGRTDVFENGDGIKVNYNNFSQILYYENKDSVIINKVIDMIKDTLHYVQIYDYDGNYEYTRFLNPLHVETDEYTIESDHFFQAFLTDYWIDYISKHNFTIYKYNKIIGELPEPDGEITQDIYLDDENGNIFQYAYDRKDNMRCTVDKENDSKYYCEYESE